MIRDITLVLATSLLVVAVMLAIWSIAYRQDCADQQLRDQTPADTRQTYDPAAI